MTDALPLHHQDGPNIYNVEKGEIPHDEQLVYDPQCSKVSAAGETSNAVHIREMVNSKQTIELSTLGHNLVVNLLFWQMYSKCMDFPQTNFAHPSNGK